MITEGIIVAIITGGCALLGVIIQTYKCKKNENNNLLIPKQILNVRYEPPDLKNIDKYINTKNGKYKIKLPPGLRMMPSNVIGTVNIFREYSTNYGNCNLELELSNIKGDVDLFVKRFDNNWNFVENGAITTQPATNGYNKMNIISRIDQGDVKKEQIGLMVYSGDIEYSSKCFYCKKYSNLCGWCKDKNITTCNINKANIEYHNSIV